MIAVRGTGRASTWFLPRLTRPDPWLLGAVACLIGLGVVMVFNVSYFLARESSGDPYSYFRRHLFAVALSGGVGFVLSRLRPQAIERLATVALLFSMVGLVLLLIPGLSEVHGGARRWLCVGGHCVQPAEFVKVLMVAYLARNLSRRRDRIDEFRTGLLPPLIVVGACAVLMLRQPDFGGTVILGVVAFAMLFAAGARPMHLAVLGLLGLCGFAGGILFWAYRLRRLMAFIDPWAHSRDAAYQLVQSLIAFGSGGLTGVGLGQSRQMMFFLPEGHTDFIFALVGEELGLAGAVIVMGLFWIIAWRGFRVAVRHPDLFASLLAFGLTLVIVLGAVVNMGVVMGLLPTKGLVLPFLSYGGSGLLAASMAVGILAGLSRMTG